VVTLKLHSRGDAVRALQHQLRYAYGHRSVVVDGYLARRPWLR
jgi:peptidoglycan hydrolase-like protein with peptidoglycan-binding domain